MDTEKARVFMTVVNEGSLSAAAEKLGYTTSGISRSIAAIEAETGCTLFVRGRKGVRLTEDAAGFLPIMRELVHQGDMLLETAARLRGLETGTLTIGVSYGGYFKLISDGLKQFKKQYPGIKVRTLQATSTELLGALENHDVDLALMTYRDSGLNFYELQNSPMVACVPEGHPLADLPAFSLRQFEKESYIAPYPNMDTDYSRVLEGAGICPNIQYSTMDIYAAYCMVESGLGVSLLNRLEIKDWNGKVVIMKTEPEVCFKIGIMYPGAGEMTIAAKRFLSTVTGARISSLPPAGAFTDKL